MAKNSKSLLAAVVLAVAGLGTSPLFGADTPIIYTGPNNGSYNTIGNWTPQAVPNGPTYAVTIGDPTDPNVTVTLQIPISVDTLTIDAGSTLQLLNGAGISNTTLTTFGNGSISTAGGQFTPQLSGNITLTTGSTLNIVDNSGLNFIGGSTYTNNGTINLLSAGNDTRIALNGGGTVTFAGNGAIVMGAGGNNYIAAFAAGMTLDNALSHTISGNGQFNDAPGGSSSYIITNEGTITALNGTMTINQAGGLTNTGILQAGNANGTGTLVLENETYTNTGGIIAANNNSTVLINNRAIVTDGTLQTNGNGTISATSGNSSGQISGNTTLTAGSNIVIRDNSGINFTGAFTNDGTITLASAGNDTRIALNGGGTVTFGGNGSVVMNAGGNNYIAAFAAGMTLDNTLSHTISGNGQFTTNVGGASTYVLTNEGAITALNGTMTITQGGGVTNTGTLQAGDGTSNGTLVLQNETYINTGGIIAANNNSTVLINNGAIVTDGTFKTSGNGIITASNGNFSGQISGNTTLTAGSNIVIRDNSGINFTGAFTNDGTITLASASDDTRIALNGGGTVTFGGNGSVVMNAGGNNYIAAFASGMTLDNTLSHTISGNGQFNSTPGGSSPYIITNEGTITALNGTMTIDQIGGVTNTGTLQAGDGTATGTLVLENETFTNTGAQIIANAGSTVLLNTNATVVGGTLASNGNGTFSTSSGQSSATLTGPITLTAGTTITILDNSYLNFTGDSTYTNNGTISLLSAGNQTDLAIVGNGTVSFAGSGSIVLATNNVNNIIVARSANMTLDNTANHTISGSGQFTRDPGGTSAYDITNEGAITALVGVLRFNQSGNVTNTGTLRAGDGTANGTLALQNDTFNNTNGLIEALAGSQVTLENGASIIGGTIQSVGNGSISTINSTATEQLSGNISFPAGTNLNIVDSSRLNFAAGSTYTNNGTISLISTGNATQIGLNGTGTVTFGGSGSIQLSTNQPNGNQIVAFSVGITLDNTANHTISGAGIFTNSPGGSSPYAITNEGTITALNGTMQINQGGIVTNTGTLRAGDGTHIGTLDLQAVTFNNVGGLIEALTGSSVSLQNGSSIIGGTIQSVGNGSISTVNAQSAQISGNVMLSTGTNLNIVDNSRLNFAGGSTYTNNGTISLISTGNATQIGINGTGTVTFGGSGSIQLSTNQPNGNQIVAFSVGITLDNTANHTISGAGIFTNNPGGATSYAITNEGAITALNGIMQFDQFGNVTNTGTLRAGDGTNTGTLDLQSDTFNNAGGLIEALAGSLLSVQNGSSIIGGTIQSVGNGSISTVSQQFLAQLSGNITFSAGTNITIPDNSGLNFAGGGTYTNNGTISLLSAGNDTRIALNGGGTVTFNGSGSIVMAAGGNNYISAFATGMTLDNAASHTISGNGQLNNVTGGSAAFTITNEGTFLANISGKTLTLSPGISTANTGTFEATAGGSLNVTGVFVQDTTGTLAAGTYIVNDGSTLTLSNSPAITTIDAAATVILTGPNSAFPQIDTTPASGSVAAATGTVTTNNGTLEFLGGRNYTVAEIFSNNLFLQLGGGTFTAPNFTNGSAATLFGFGNVDVRPVNDGLIEANGGTLAFSDGIDPTADNSTLQSDSGATLDLSAGASGSMTGNLINNGNLTLGNNNVEVSQNYTNANFGTGNSFNKHANVATTGGQILADGDNTELLSAATLDFQHVHVGDTHNLTYTITNAGTNGPSVLYAIRPTTNGGTLSDSRLSGSGVTSSNVGPLAIGATSAPLTITFTAAGDGPLTNQAVDIDNNFDNITSQTLSITGTAYNYAAPSVANTTLSLGNFHVSTTPISANYTIGNTAPADGYSEQLDANASGSTGSITITGITTVAAGASNSTAISAFFVPTAAGHQTGSAILNLTSDGAGTSGLGLTALSGVPLTASADVYRFAAPSTPAPNPINFGNHHVGDTVAPSAFLIGNVAADDGFSEKLDGSLSGVSTSGIALTGNLSLVAPGSSAGTILATLDTSSAGNKSAFANVDFVSDGTGTSNLGNTPLTGQSAFIAASGNVYRLAVPATVTNINLGTLHVGDPGAAAITIGNTAPADGFSENLDASFSTPITGPVSASSNTITVGPASTNSIGLILTLDTSAAAIAKTGSATVHFASDGTGSSGLGMTSLSADQTVSITANVLNFARATAQKDSGDGNLTIADPTDVTLNFGDVTAGDTVSAMLGILNAAAGPSDTLAGAFTIGSGDFTTAGFSSFSGITAGGEQSGLAISFSNATPGLYTETITLAPRSQDVSFDGALPDITITVSANVISSGVPEPASLSLLGLGAAALLTRRKR